MNKSGKIYFDDTIAAVATPIGQGAISVIRVSGANAISTIDKIFRGSIKICKAAPFTIHLGKLHTLEEVFVDEVMVSVFRAPKSYDGEDIVEVSCHGGLYITQRVFAAILSAGARQAQPGEFTKRAFLNGKIDLSEAEAVADLIAARSESSYRASVHQLEGRFSKEIRKLKSELLDLNSLLEIDLDFSEEGIPSASKADLLSKIRHPKSRVEKMIGTYETGKRSRDGVSVAIIGKPNAGKSSLFNALLLEERAIVSEIPGTTRDFIEENILINGVIFRLNDTAGLADSADTIEKEGVSRSIELIKKSDILLYVIDMSVNNEIDYSILNGNKSAKMIVFNKSDLLPESVQHQRFAAGAKGFECLIVSAKNGSGLNDLRNKMFGLLFSNSDFTGDGSEITNVRHYTLLCDACKSLIQADKSACDGISNEFLATEIRRASDSLSEIIGEFTSEDTLNNIFSSFCIGK